MIRNLLISIAIMLATAMPPSAFSFDNTDIEKAFGNRKLDALEGLWQFPADGATLMIVRSSATTYDIIIVDSPNLNLHSGSHIGTAVTTAKSKIYDAKFKTTGLDKILKKSNAVLTINDNGLLCFQEYSKGKKLVLWRWLPYLTRIAISDNNTKPKGLVGARKIYPLDQTTQKPSL